MATNYYSTTYSNATTATFQAWGSALAAAIQACGMSKTADTGQINWNTVVLPTASSTSAGYEIYAFNDTLQSTYPIYIRIDYGTGPRQLATNPNGDPQIWITVGTATNGAGSITTNTSGLISLIATNSSGGGEGVTSTSTPYPTYVCFDGSYLGVAHKIGGYSSPYYTAWPCGAFMVGRLNNSDGTYSSGGYVIFHVSQTNSGTGVAQWTAFCMNTSNSTSTTNTGAFAMIPYSLTSTSFGGGEYQVFPCFASMPQVSTINWAAYGLLSETAQGNTVSTTILGSTAQTYLMLGNAALGAGVPSTTAYSLLMKYQ